MSAGPAGLQPCIRCASGHRPCPPHQSGLCSPGQSSRGRGPALPWTHCWVSKANPPEPWGQAPCLASQCPESSEKEPGTRGGTRGIPPLVGAEPCAPSGQTSLDPWGGAGRTDRSFTALPCHYPKLKGRKDDAGLLSSEIKTTQEYMKESSGLSPSPQCEHLLGGHHMPGIVQGVFPAFFTHPIIHSRQVLALNARPALPGHSVAARGSRPCSARFTITCVRVCGGGRMMASTHKDIHDSDEGMKLVGAVTRL